LKILSNPSLISRIFFDPDNIRDGVSINTLKNWGTTSAIFKSLKIDAKVLKLPFRSVSQMMQLLSPSARPDTAKTFQLLSHRKHFGKW
jgi:hypothetical protein